MVGPASAQSPYDGLWQVTVVTKNGSCDAQTTSTVNVTDGTEVFNLVLVTEHVPDEFVTQLGDPLAPFEIELMLGTHQFGPYSRQIGARFLQLAAQALHPSVRGGQADA